MLQTELDFGAAAGCWDTITLQLSLATCSLVCRPSSKCGSMASLAKMNIIIIFQNSAQINCDDEPASPRVTVLVLRLPLVGATEPRSAVCACVPLPVLAFAGGFDGAAAGVAAGSSVDADDACIAGMEALDACALGDHSEYFFGVFPCFFWLSDASTLVADDAEGRDAVDAGIADGDAAGCCVGSCARRYVGTKEGAAA